MRIRKRSMQPLFSLSPSPQTAPDLPQQEKDDRFQKEPGTREKQGGENEDRSDRWIPHDEMNKRCCMLSTPKPKLVEAMKGKGEEEEEQDEDEKRWGARDMSSKSERNGSMSCRYAETVDRVSSSSRAVGKWQEGERAFPFKKRKASYQYVKETMIGKEKKMKTKLKNTKIPEEEEEKEEEEEGNGDDTSFKRRGSNGSPIMEGLRCSRVNGRGWRCCQQTVVGYSLCEHHLGKGRLRSMISGQSRACDNGLLLSTSSSKMMQEEDNLAVEDEKEEEKLTTMVMNSKKIKMKKKKKKKKKTRVVKARSVSSLLDQTRHATTATLGISQEL